MTHIRRQLAIDTADGSEAAAVRLGVAAWTRRYRNAGAGATITETTGYWDGASATGLQITFDWPEGHEGYFLWEFLISEVKHSTKFQTLGHETSYPINFTERKLR